MHLNLLPHDYRLKLLVRRGLRHWSKVWVACTALLLAPLAWKFLEMTESKARMSLVEGRCQPTRAIEHQTRSLAGESETLSREHPFALGLDLAQRALFLIGELGQGVSQSDGKLQLLRLDLRTAVESARPNPPAKTAAAVDQAAVINSIVTLHGVSLDDASVARFMSQLRDHELLSALKLKSYSARPAATGVVRDYQIEGSL